MKKRAIILSVSALGATTAFLLATLNAAPGSYKPREGKNGLSATGQESEIRGAIDQIYSGYRANPATGEVDPADVYKAINDANRQRSLAKAGYPLIWEELGPDNVGGRTRAILIDNRDNNVIYAGGVGGGLWRSTNKALNWNKINDQFENLAISSIAQTPDGTIFFGTGERTFTRGSNGIGNSGVVGGGIWKSSNGLDFTRLTNTRPNSTSDAWADINCLAAHPTQNVVYAALNGTNPLRYSDDGGTSWKNCTGITGTSIGEVKVATDGTVWATGSGRVFRNTSGNAGGPFENKSSGITGAIVRISIAISPQDPNFVYAAAARTSDNRLLAIYRSTDKGESWNIIGSGGSPFFDPFFVAGNGQGDYDNVIAVDPENKDRIFVGGVDWWEWNLSSGWVKTANTFENPYNRVYIHADKHAIVFDTKSDPYIMYVGTDGGVGRSDDKGKTFGVYNRGYNVTQFYALAANNAGNVVGGTQDNGTQFINQKGNTKMAAVEVLGGDGFYTELSRKNPNFMIAETYYGQTSRSFNGGETFTSIWSCDLIKYVFPSVTDCKDKTTRFSNIFSTPLELWESETNNESRFAIALDNTVWFTFDITDASKVEPAWYRVANAVGAVGTTGENITCLSFSANGEALFVGTNRGRITRLKLDNTDWDTLGVGFTGWWNNPGARGVQRDDLYIGAVGTSRVITGIATDPSNDNRIVVTVGNYGSNQYVFQSTNALDVAGSVNFSSIQGNLPAMPVYDAAINIDDPKDIILATELGVWASEDNGATWAEQNTGMARVAVYQIRQYEFKPWEGPQFYIATHGRGIYRTNSLTTSVKAKQVNNEKIDLQVYPNPANESAQVQFNLTQATETVLSVYDMQGKIAYQETLKNTRKGINQSVIPTALLQKGIYLVTVETATERNVVKLSITH